MSQSPLHDAMVYTNIRILEISERLMLIIEKMAQLEERINKMEVTCKCKS